MFINVGQFNEEKVEIEPITFEKFKESIKNSLGFNEDIDLNNWLVQETVVSRFLLLDCGTYKDISFVDNPHLLLSCGIHKIYSNEEEGIHYLVCWAKSYVNYSAGEACFIIYSTGTELRGFVPYDGNPINLISNSILVNKSSREVRKVDEECDSLDNIDYLVTVLNINRDTALDILSRQKIEIDYESCISNFKNNLTIKI